MHNCTDQPIISRIMPGLASFMKMAVMMNSLIDKDSVDHSIRMDIEYQHVLSWSWQVLKNTANILVSWCRAVVNDNHGGIIRDIGVILLKVLCQSRHRGTIECVAGCLQTYIQLGEGSDHRAYWLTAREVAIDECIEGAVRGQYSITRRSAGLPLVLMSALTGCSGTTAGSVLASECLERLMGLCGADEETCGGGGGDTDGWCDPQVVHYLNLMRQMCHNPSLQPALQRYYGNVILITLAQFSSPIWGVRNAALQLFTAMLSRVASVTKGLTSNPTYSELFSLYPQLWTPIVQIITDGSVFERSFMKHQTLVPTLTLLSNLQYCHDNQLPRGLQLDTVLACLWPLLGSQVITVRKLAARCIVHCVPHSSVAIGIIQSNTDLIPILQNANFTIETLSKISSNRQHGELFLLQLSLKTLSRGDNQPKLSIESLLQYGHILCQRRCWVLLDAVIGILLKIDIASDHRNTIAIFFSNLFHDILQSSPSLFSIGRLDVLVAIVKLISLFSHSTESIIRSLLHDNHADILQQLCTDVKYCQALPSPIPDLFTGNMTILLQSVESALIDYRQQYSPYVIQLFCIVIDCCPGVCAPVDYDWSVLVERLHNVPIISESFVVNCHQIVSWIYSRSGLEMGEEGVNRWMCQLDCQSDPQSLETSRLSAAKSLAMLMASDNFNDVIKYRPDQFAVVLTFGCFDEGKSVRDIFRCVLHSVIAHESPTSQRASKLLDKSDLATLYDTVCQRSGWSRESVVVDVWRSLVCKQREFLELVRSLQAKYGVRVAIGLFMIGGSLQRRAL